MYSIIPKYCIFKANKQDILNLKVSLVSFKTHKSNTYEIENYFTYYYDYKDEQYLSFDFENFIIEQIQTQNIAENIKDMQFFALSFNEKKLIYEKTEIIVYRLKKIDFSEYFGVHAQSVTNKLIDTFFQFFDIKLKVIYLEILLLHTNSNKKNIFLTPIKDNKIYNYKLFNYIVENSKNLSFTKLQLISNTNPNNIEIDLQNSIQKITKKIKILKEQRALKLKQNISDRKEQLLLALKILYTLNSGITKKLEILKNTVRLGHIYKIDNYDVNYHNMEEEYMDWERIYKNNRTFKETLSLFNWKNKDDELPF